MVLSLLCHSQIVYFVAQYNYINKFNDNKVKVLFSSLIFGLFCDLNRTTAQHTLTRVIFILKNGKFAAYQSAFEYWVDEFWVKNKEKEEKSFFHEENQLALMR